VISGFEQPDKQWNGEANLIAESAFEMPIGNFKLIVFCDSRRAASSLRADADAIWMLKSSALSCSMSGGIAG